MARVPIVSQDVRMRTSSPVEIGSSNQARLGGEALSTLGEGATRLGFGLMEFDKRKKDELENVLAEQFANRAQDEFNQLDIKYSQDAELPKKPVAEVLNQYNKDSEEAMTRIAKDMGISGMTLLKARNRANNTRLDYAGRMKAFAMDSSVKYIQKQYEAIENQTYLKINNDPGKFQDYLGELYDVVEKSPTTNPRAKEEVSSGMYSKAFQAAVDGYISKGMYNGAEKFVRKHGTHLAPKDLDDTVDKIRDKEYEKLGRDFQTESHGRTQLDWGRQDARRRNEVQILDAFFDENVTLSEKNKMLAQARLMEAEGVFSSGALATMRSDIVRIDKDLSKTRKANYMVDIYNESKPLNELESLILDDVNKGGALNPEDAAPLITLIHRKQGKQSERNKEAEKAAQELMRAPFKAGIEGLDNSLNPISAHKKYAETLVSYYEFRNRGIKQVDAARMSLKLNLGDVKSLGSIPLLHVDEQGSKEKLKSGAARIIKEYEEKEKSGKATSDEKKRLLESLNLIENQINILDVAETVDRDLVGVKEQKGLWDKLKDIIGGDEE